MWDWLFGSDDDDEDEFEYVEFDGDERIYSGKFGPDDGEDWDDNDWDD